MSYQGDVLSCHYEKLIIFRKRISDNKCTKDEFEYES